jgi:hypothetical protein
MKTIKRIDPMSLAKVLAVLWAVSGFITGLFAAAAGSMVYTFFAPMMSSLGMDFSAYLAYGWAAIVAIPIIQAIVGFILGLVVAWVYNYIARWVGGIKIELK